MKGEKLQGKMGKSDFSNLRTNAVGHSVLPIFEGRFVGNVNDSLRVQCLVKLAASALAGDEGFGFVPGDWAGGDGGFILQR